MRKQKTAAAGHSSSDNQALLAGSAVPYIAGHKRLDIQVALASNNAAAAGHSAIDSHSARVVSAATYSEVDGHSPCETHGASVAHPDAAEADHFRNVNHERIVSPAANNSANASGSSQRTLEIHGAGADPLAPIIDDIRALHRRRVFAMDRRKTENLALGAFLRRHLGWRRDLPKDESDRIKKHAADLMSLGEKIRKGKATGLEDSAFDDLGQMIMTSIQCRLHWDEIEDKCTKEMERLAESLPVWPLFGEPIKGFGARSLAVIVGEAGNLSNYANPGKLWKRMGMAVIDGVRQGGLRKTAAKEEWIQHGYNAKRRAAMFVIGDVLIKNQNEYRTVYLERKQFERDKWQGRGFTIVPAAKIPAKNKETFMSDGHIHKKAQRYMEKRLLRNLWRAWRQATGALKTNEGVPVAPYSAQAERSARSSLSTILDVPSAKTTGGHASLVTQQRGAAKRSAIERQSTRTSVPSAKTTGRKPVKRKTTPAVTSQRTPVFRNLNGEPRTDDRT